MRVLLISLNRETFPMAVMPVGVLHIAANLRQAGHAVRLLDLGHIASPETEIRQAIADFAPELIGFSLRNMENHQMIGFRSYLPEARALVQTAMNCTSVPVVVGGASFGLFAKEITDYLGISCGLAGEAEHAIVEFVRRLEAGEPYFDIPGLCYLRDRKVVQNPAEQIVDFAALPLPAFDLFNPAPYLAGRAAWGVETKRGCEFACSFCPESAQHELYRLRDPRLVVDEIEAALSHGIDRFAFVDTIFNHPTHHAVAVCEEILRRDLKVRWSAGFTAVDLRAEVIDLVKRAGCLDVFLGIDAATAETLGVYRKAFNLDDIRHSFELLAQAGVGFSTGVLFGGPGETSEIIDESVAFLESLPPPRFLSFNLGIRVYPGTALEPLARADGWSEGDGGMSKPHYYVSSALPPDIADRLDAVCRPRANWFTTRVFLERFRPQ